MATGSGAAARRQRDKPYKKNLAKLKPKKTKKTQGRGQQR